MHANRDRPPRRGVGLLIRKRLYRVAQWWWRIRGPRLTLGVRALVTDRDGRVCLVRHSYRDGWFLPGGGVKTGESLVQAMTRELGEETGIEPSRNSHPVHGVFSSFAEHKSDHIVVFHITDWRQGRRPGQGEIAEVRFVDPNDLPADTSPATQRRIKELVTGAPVGHRW